jgi:hypothetical protein
MMRRILGDGESKEQARAARKLLPDDVRHQHLKAVLTTWHEAKKDNITYDEAILRTKNQYADLQTAKGTVSVAVANFKALHFGVDPRRYPLAELLSCVRVKTIGRGDTLTDARLQKAGKLFDIAAVNFKASPDFNDWGKRVACKSEEVVALKFGGYSVEYLL